MYIRSLSIQNLRSFESEELPLCYPGERPAPDSESVPHLDNVTLLLGSNGAGKTTVLRAAALSTLAPVLAMGSGYVPYALVRRVKGRPTGEARAEAKVILHEQDGLKEGEEAAVKATLVAPSRGYTDRFIIDAHPPRWQVRLYEEEESPAFLVLGYGATRRVETGPGSPESRAKERVLRYRRVAGLFEEHMTLMPLSAWLPRVKDRKRQHEIVELMNRLLPDIQMLEKWGAPEAPECLFRRAGSVLPYPALSDGYRAFICWVGDLLYHLNMVCPKGQPLVNMRGVVLVDEVDLHLHPEWQRHLVPSLSRTLPRMQFVLTSHSPLVVGTLSSRNVLFLTEQVRSGEVRVTRVQRPGEELYGLSADQILTSDTFGLESTRDDRFFERLKDVAGQAREGGAAEALRFMRMVAGGGAAESGPSYAVPGRELLVLQGHENEVRGIAWSPDGLRLASASFDTTVRLWDAETGRQQGVLRGHADWVNDVAWSPDGESVASASLDGTVRLWNVHTRSDQHSILRGHEKGVLAVAWAPGGITLASASLDNTVRLWLRTRSQLQLPILRGHQDAVQAIAWSPLGGRLASASNDHTVRLWDTSGLLGVDVLEGHKKDVTAVAWSPDGLRLASASLDGTVRFWDAQAAREQESLQVDEKGVLAVAWSPDGRRLASASQDGTVRLWDVATARQQMILRGHEKGVLAVAWSPDGRKLASASQDGTIRVWATPTEMKKDSVKKPSRKAPRKRASPGSKASRRRSQE